MKQLIFSFGAILLFLSSCTDKSEITPPEDGLLTNETGDLSELKAVGKYNGSASCTAVFVRTSDNDNTPAYVLTNGHCATDWSSNKVHVDVTDANQQVTFNMFKGVNAADQVVVNVKKIAYSTMKGTDLAIVELNTSIKELISKGINPLPLAKALPVAGAPIKAYGIPVNDIANEDRFLRQSSCFQGRKTDVIEGNWTWWDMYSNECANIVGGSSGSPVFTNLKEGVFGLLNTTTIGAQSPCYIGAPCESSNSGVGMKSNTSYTLSVVGLEACFNTNGVFDVNNSGCFLEKDNGVEIEGSPIGEINPTATMIGQRPVSMNWDYEVVNKNYYRYKIGKVGVDNPRDINGYKEVTNASTKITDLLPTEEGHYFLAVLGGNNASFGDDWQSVKHPTMVRIEVDKKAPALEPIVNITDFGDMYSIQLGFSPPELSNYVYKIGKPDEIDANDPNGYITFRRIPISVNKADLPLKICVIGYNNAGNPTKTFEKVISN